MLFHPFAIACPNSNPVSDSGYVRLSNQGHSQFTQTNYKALLELLWNFHEGRCLDPKDRIVALFGLVPDDRRFHLDYTVHWNELYKQVASSILNLGDNNTRLQVLLYSFEFGTASLPEDVAYPSWVPDWSKTRQRDLPYDSYIKNPDTYEPYPTSLGDSAKASLTFDRGALQIHWHVSIGVLQVIDVIRFVSPPRDKGQSMERVISILEKLFPHPYGSASRILAVSALLKMITEFRASQHDQ